MSKWLLAAIQFFPLSLFATYAFWNGPPTDSRWLEAFQIAAVAGLIQLVIVLHQEKPVNRLVLAGNTYLIFGGIAVITTQWWYLQIYDALQESAIFLCIIIVGCISTFATRSGFIASISESPMLIRRASYYLLAASFVALPISYIFQGNRYLAAVLPILGLAILQRILVHRIAVKSDQ